MLRYLLLTIFVVALFSCGEQKTGPVDVKWDRDVCNRCQMMLSDRKFSAQIRVFPEGKRSKVFRFDDVGCASLWLNAKDQQTWEADNNTEFWVTDMNTGEWINARTAWYIEDLTTPMNYGLGAISPSPNSVKKENTLDYEKARKHILDVEQKLNIHGGNFTH